MKTGKVFFLAISVITLVVFIVPVTMYFMTFTGGISDNDQNWANFGTFIGGVITSVFSYISFILVLYTFLKSNEDKKKDEETTLFFNYLGMLNNCKSNVTVRIGATAQFGHEVFSTFSALVAALVMEKKFGEISLKKNRSRSEDEFLKGQCLKYFFFRNSLRPFSDLLEIILEFITKDCKNHKEKFLSVLISHLSEQEKMAYGILNHNKISEDIKSRFFVNTLQFEGIKNMAAKSEEITARM